MDFPIWIWDLARLGLWTRACHCPMILGCQVTENKWYAAFSVRRPPVKTVRKNRNTFLVGVLCLFYVDKEEDNLEVRSK